MPIALFLVLVVSVLALMALGQPRQTMLGAAIVVLGVPVSWVVVPRRIAAV